MPNGAGGAAPSSPTLEPQQSVLERSAPARPAAMAPMQELLPRLCGWGRTGRSGESFLVLERSQEPNKRHKSYPLLPLPPICLPCAGSNTSRCCSTHSRTQIPTKHRCYAPFSQNVLRQQDPQPSPQTPVVKPPGLPAQKNPLAPGQEVTQVPEKSA